MPVSLGLTPEERRERARELRLKRKANQTPAEVVIRRAVETAQVKAYRSKRNANQTHEEVVIRRAVVATQVRESKRKILDNETTEEAEIRRAATAAKLKVKRHTDPIRAIQDRVRQRFYQCRKANGFKKTRKTEELLGCTWAHAVEYLENNDRGLKLTDKSVQVDHVRPLASFKNLHCEFEQRTANNFRNLELLPAEENQQKGASFDYDSWAASDAGKQLLELNREWRMERYFQ
jgi:hypothetical protein